MERSINLKEAVNYLDTQGIGVGLYLGNHEFCGLDTNCPLAVKVRTVFVEANVEIPTEPVTIPDNQFTLPPAEAISGEINLHLLGQTVSTSISQTCNIEVQAAFNRKVRELRNRELEISQLGMSLWSEYLRKLHSRETQLVQLSLDLQFILAHRVSITSMNNQYVVSMYLKYSPEQLDEEGVISKIEKPSLSDIVRDTYLTFYFEKETNQYKLRNTLLYKADGNKFTHYHGTNSRDCWGTIPASQTWNGTTGGLLRLYHQYEGSLKTINLLSLYNQAPPGLPTTRQLKENSTPLLAPRDEASHNRTPHRWGER